MDLGRFPIALMAPVMLVPFIYCALWRRDRLRKTASLWSLSVVIVILYPLVTYANEHAGDFGHFLAKLAFLVLLPVALLMNMKKWSARLVMINVGVRRKNLGSS